MKSQQLLLQIVKHLYKSINTIFSAIVFVCACAFSFLGAHAQNLRGFATTRYPFQVLALLRRSVGFPLLSGLIAPIAVLRRKWSVAVPQFNVSQTISLLTFGIIILSFTACNETGSSIGTLGNALKKDQKQNPNYTCDMLSNKIHSISYSMKINSPNKEHIRNQTLDAYSTNDYQLLWQGDKSNNPSPQIQNLLTTLKKADKQGFDSKAYQIDVADTLYNQIYKQNKFKDEQLLLNKIDLDLLLTASALSYMSDLSNGRMKHKWDVPKSANNLGDKLAVALQKNELQQGFDQAEPDKYLGYSALTRSLSLCKALKAKGAKKATSKDAKSIAQRLAIMGDYKGDIDGIVNGNITFDNKLTEALKGFQKRKGFSVTGKPSTATLNYLNKPLDELIEKLELNIERMRWLPDDLGSKYVFVNIPEYKIRIVEDGKDILEMRSVVGETSTPTPVFCDQIEYVVFSPTWTIPQSITREHIIDWLIREPSLLYVSDVDVIHKGVKKDAHAVDWEHAKKNLHEYTFRQRPTDQNSMGDVKFIFPNRYSVFLHDTPDGAKKHFGDRTRALSAGCVRVEKPAEMAQNLLADKGWNIGKVKGAMSREKEWRVNLSKDVPVYLYYLTVRADKEGRLLFYSDLYGHDRRQLKKIREII